MDMEILQDLPVEIQMNIFKFVSHPCANMIKEAFNDHQLVDVEQYQNVYGYQMKSYTNVLIDTLRNYHKRGIQCYNFYYKSSLNLCYWDAHIKHTIREWRDGMNREKLTRRI